MAAYRSLQIWVKKGHRMHPYFQNMCQNAKNMHNTTNFYIRQVFIGLKQERELQPLQQDVLETIQNHLPEINANQLKAYQKRSAKEQEKAESEQTEIKCLLFEMPSKNYPYISYLFLKYGQYVVELVFQVHAEAKRKEAGNRFLAVDLGIDNLATIVTNTGKRAVLVKSKNIKSVNQRYNQLKAYYTGIRRQGKNTNEGSFTSKRLEKISQKRFLQIKDLFHKASFQIVKIALEEDIDTIIIG